MNLLVDTPTFLWFVAGDERLARSARRLLEAEDSILYVSMASLWEIAIKYSLGKIILEDDLEDFLEERFREGFRSLPIEIEHIAHAASLPFHHRDPFDRMLVSQAILEDFTLVSGDPQFKPYKVRVRW